MLLAPARELDSAIVPSPVHAFAPFAAALEPLLRAALPGREVICWRDEAAFAAGIGEVEYLFVLAPPRNHWAAAERLKLIQCLGAGVDDLLPARDLAARVVIANNRGMSAESMAEFALALVLALVKKLPFFVEAQQAREWRRTLPGVAAGSTLGIVGMGAIGQALARKAHALGMRVLATQRSPKPEPAVERIFDSAGTHELLAQSDLVVLLLPLTDETRGSFGSDAFAAMKPGGQLINLARGGIVDESALLEALTEGTIAGAIFDVFSREPLPEDSPLWEAPNFWITPHTAGGFPDLLERAIAGFAENVLRMERGEAVLNRVDRERGY